MALTVAEKLPNAGAGLYYDPNWQLMIETHLPLIVGRADNTVETITPALGWKYNGDFYGLLTELNIPQRLHWVILRANGLRSPNDYRYEQLSIIIPNPTVVEEYTSRYRTTMKKIK